MESNRSEVTNQKTNKFQVTTNQRQLGLMRVEGFTGRSDANPFHVQMVVIGVGQGGGRIADEFARIGYPAYAINSSNADLADLYSIKQENRIHLEGFEGAAKNIAVGAQAVISNGEMLTELLSREEIMEADYVILCASFGGGTGNGGFPLIAQVVSDLREEKRTLDGKPTVGGIITLPASFEKTDSKINAIAGMEKIIELHNSQSLGAVLIVDNDKLAKDYYEFSGAGEIGYKNWMSYGNTLIASALYEIATTTSLPALKVFDKAEFLDIMSTPGFLTFGKFRVTHEIDNETTINKIVQSAFYNSEFASGYKFEKDSSVGGIITLYQPFGTVDDKVLLEIEKNASHVLQSAKRVHTGSIANKSWEVMPERFNKVTPLASGLMYTLCVMHTLPERFQEMNQEVDTELEQERIREEERKAQMEQLKMNSSFKDRFQLNVQENVGKLKNKSNAFSEVGGNAFGLKKTTRQNAGTAPKNRFSQQIPSVDDDVELP